MINNGIIWYVISTIIGGINIILFIILYNSAKNKIRENSKWYAVDCPNCGLEFDFGDHDIKTYTDLNGEKHQITECPRCHNYINVDP